MILWIKKDGRKPQLYLVFLPRKNGVKDGVKKVGGKNGVKSLMRLAISWPLKFQFQSREQAFYCSQASIKVAWGPLISLDKELFQKSN